MMLLVGNRHIGLLLFHLPVVCPFLNPPSLAYKGCLVAGWGTPPLMACLALLPLNLMTSSTRSRKLWLCLWGGSLKVTGCGCSLFTTSKLPQLAVSWVFAMVPENCGLLLMNRMVPQDFTIVKWLDLLKQLLSRGYHTDNDHYL